MNTRLLRLAIAGAMFGLSAGAANAGLIINVNGGAPDEAQAENQANYPGSLGFPVGLPGWEHPAQLVAAHEGWYRFTFYGSGDSTDTNTFRVVTDPNNNVFHSRPGFANTSFDVFFTAGTVIPFLYQNETTGCEIRDGGNATIEGSCHYLLALQNGSDGPAQQVAYIGLSDRPGTEPDGGDCGGDCDFQDLTVRVDQLIPAPATLALFGAGLLGLVFSRRRSS